MAKRTWIGNLVKVNVVQGQAKTVKQKETKWKNFRRKERITDRKLYAKNRIPNLFCLCKIARYRPTMRQRRACQRNDLQQGCHIATDSIQGASASFCCIIASEVHCEIRLICAYPFKNDRTSCSEPSAVKTKILFSEICTIFRFPLSFGFCFALNISFYSK